MNHAKSYTSSQRVAMHNLSSVVAHIEQVQSRLDRDQEQLMRLKIRQLGLEATINGNQPQEVISFPELVS